MVIMCTPGRYASGQETAVVQIDLFCYALSCYGLMPSCGLTNSLGWSGDLVVWVGV